MGRRSALISADWVESRTDVEPGGGGRGSFSVGPVCFQRFSGIEPDEDGQVESEGTEESPSSLPLPPQLQLQAGV